MLCCDPKTLQLVARRVRLIKEAVEPEPPEYTKRQVRPRATTRRVPPRGLPLGKGGHDCGRPASLDPSWLVTRLGGAIGLGRPRPTRDAPAALASDGELAEVGRRASNMRSTAPQLDAIRALLNCMPSPSTELLLPSKCIHPHHHPLHPAPAREQVDPAKMTRFAKGPDGTRGFAVGRGKGLTPASARAAET